MPIQVKQTNARDTPRTGTRPRPTHNSHARLGALTIRQPDWTDRHSSGSRQDTHGTLGPVRGEGVGGSAHVHKHVTMCTWVVSQHDPQSDKRNPTEQTPPSLTTYMVEEPCSVQFSSARIQQRTERRYDAQEVDVGCQGDALDSGHTPGHSGQERGVDRQSPE